MNKTMNKTPKTILLFARGARRYPVVPGVWVDCLKKARRQKAWAARIQKDRAWMKGACDLSKAHLTHVLATNLTDLAKEGYRYLEARAHLGNPKCWDRPARKLWLRLGGHIRRPRKSVIPA